MQLYLFYYLSFFISTYWKNMETTQTENFLRHAHQSKVRLIIKPERDLSAHPSLDAKTTTFPPTHTE